MKRSVIDAWHTFSTPLEGRVHSMYLDVRGLVTTGVGNLVDASQSGSSTPWAPALSLPWRHANETLATTHEISAAWKALKARQDLARLHWRYAARLNDLRLTDAAIDALVAGKLMQFERELRKHFRTWDGYPADAQLGIASMAWAMGPAFPLKFTRFAFAANAGDWIAARAACAISPVIHEGTRTIPNPGTIPRNVANALCFENAATVLRHGLDPERLYWPDTINVAGTPGTIVAVTMPTLRRGDFGDAVHVLQGALHVESDGIFGANTETALRAYQSAHALTADGVCGPRTWEAIRVG